MRRRMGCHQRGSCWIQDHFLMPHPPSWLCLMLLLSSICNFSNRLDGINYSRKTLMQRRPRSDSATGHSDGINHAAPTQHRWGRELPRAQHLHPLRVWGQLGITGVSLGTEVRSQVPAEHPWVQGGSYQWRGRVSPPIPSSCPAAPARLGAARG